MVRVWIGICAFFAAGAILGVCVLLALPTTVPIPAAVGIGAATGGLGVWLSGVAVVAVYRRLRAGASPDAEPGSAADCGA